MATEGSKSTTAVGVTLLRAAGTLENDPALRNPDYLASSLLPLTLRVVVKAKPLAWLIARLSLRKLPGGYYFHTARTKHVDAVLQQCIKQGAKQVVILGAGLDTRAYRFSKELAGAKVFEIDHPSTQAIKRRRVSKLKGISTENTSYLPIDFNTESMDKLLESGYSTALPTLFIWEGVCMYITPEGVDGVLSFVKNHSGVGSSIIFDYIFQPMVEGKYDYYGARESSHYAAKSGTPYVFGIAEGKAEEFLAARGYRVLSEFTAEMLEQNYLKGSDGTVHSRVYGYTNIIHAMIQPKAS